MSAHKNEALREYELCSRDEIAAMKEKLRLLREKNGYDKHGNKIKVRS